MRHQIIQHNKIYLNKYFLIENQCKKKETMPKQCRIQGTFGAGIPLRAPKKIE